jgi:uncharacterized protein YprB with RNaseH-like and TPR domain
MVSERVRLRLEQLNRSALPPSDLAPPRSAPQRSDSTAAPFPLGELDGNNDRTGGRWTAPSDEPHLPGEEVATEWGSHWQFRQPIATVWPASSRYLSSLGINTTPAPVPPTSDGPCDDDLMALRQCFPRRTVYLDLETCGFAGSMVFLIGLLHWHQRQLVLTQFWARSYAEEKSILQSLWSLLHTRDLLVTFNGKSFDWPQVHDRSTLHHLGYRELSESGRLDSSPRPPLRSLRRDVSKGLAPNDARPEPRHLDLLHRARRRWKGHLPNCRLQTLERYICGRHRVGDLPSSAIPQAYHDYVRSGRTDEVRAILHHNALDLVTLLQLAVLFLKD